MVKTSSSSRTPIITICSDTVDRESAKAQNLKVQQVTSLAAGLASQYSIFQPTFSQIEQFDTLPP